MLDMKLMNMLSVNSPRTITMIFNIVFFEKFNTVEQANEFIEENIRAKDLLCALLRLTSHIQTQRAKFCTFDYVSRVNESKESLLCEATSMQSFANDSGFFVTVCLLCTKDDRVDEIILLGKQLNDLVANEVIKSFKQTS